MSGSTTGTEAPAARTATHGRLDVLYGNRFAGDDVAGKDAIWREVGAYLQRFVPRDGLVLDIACDRGYFVRHITAKERWATDVRDMSASLGDGIRFRQADGLALREAFPDIRFDAVFMSNYLEHLPDSRAVVEQMQVAHDILAPGGRMIILQPNIRLIGARYWDFIDHHTALTEVSLVEAAELAGFERETLVTRFLPYTTKSRLPKVGSLVRLYLRFPPAWRLMGKQTLLVASRR